MNMRQCFEPVPFPDYYLSYIGRHRATCSYRFENRQSRRIQVSAQKRPLLKTCCGIKPIPSLLHLPES